MDNPQYWEENQLREMQSESFKPYYKWITLNTSNEELCSFSMELVLNLIING